MTNNPYKKVAYIASFGTVILDDPDPSFDPYDGYDEYEYYHYNEFGYDETMAALENLARMCETVSDEAAIEYCLEGTVAEWERDGYYTPEQHEEVVKALRERWAENDFDIVPMGSDYARDIVPYGLYSREDMAIETVKSAIKFLAATGVEDEFGTLDAIRAGVPFDHVFAL